MQSYQVFLSIFYLAYTIIGFTYGVALMVESIGKKPTWAEIRYALVNVFVASCVGGLAMLLFMFDRARGREELFVWQWSMGRHFINAAAVISLMTIVTLLANCYSDLTNVIWLKLLIWLYWLAAIIVYIATINTTRKGRKS